MTHIVTSFQKHRHTNGACSLIWGKITFKKNMWNFQLLRMKPDKKPNKTFEKKNPNNTKTSKMCIFLKLPPLSFFPKFKKKNKNRSPRGSHGKRTSSTTWMDLNQTRPIITIPYRIHVSHKKKPPTFHYTGCFIGILIMVCYNPHLTG